MGKGGGGKGEEKERKKKKKEKKKKGRKKKDHNSTIIHHHKNLSPKTKPEQHITRKGEGRGREGEGEGTRTRRGGGQQHGLHTLTRYTQFSSLDSASLEECLGDFFSSSCGTNPILGRGGRGGGRVF